MCKGVDAAIGYPAVVDDGEGDVSRAIGIGDGLVGESLQFSCGDGAVGKDSGGAVGFEELKERRDRRDGVSKCLAGFNRVVGETC